MNSPVQASTVSHHLRMLAEAGLIESRREGQGVYYRWVPSKLDAYLKYLRKLAQKGKHRGPTQPIVMAIR